MTSAGSQLGCHLRFFHDHLTPILTPNGSSDGWLPRNASNAIASGWRQVPSVKSTASHTRSHCGHGNRPESDAQVDSLAFEIEIGRQHAPGSLTLQRALDELLHAADRHPDRVERGSNDSAYARARADMRSVRLARPMPLAARP